MTTFFADELNWE